ncbi:MAG: alanine racemase, partial [Flavobacteriales bacterium]|nr:alanine racemase [Flavobacteriales bacterium]
MILAPTFLVDEDKCRTNIRDMAEKARRSGVIFRPHFKTHQSQEIGSWFKEEGVDRITVSSLTMAKYFADDGWQDITVAFPANFLEADLINELARTVTLNLIVVSTVTVKELNDRIQNEINIYVKIDIGYHRTGVAPDDVAGIDTILDEIDKGPHTTFKGFLGHAGHSYGSFGKNEITNIHEVSTAVLVEKKQRYLSRYPDLLLSTGDTPTCSVIDDFSMVDEIRPGNFVFYDLMQNQIGSCSLDQITVAMACPVVAIHKEREEIIIYGGGVHFSKDRLDTQKHGTIYGLAVENEGNGWGTPIDGVYLSKVSQEHGTIHAPASYIDSISVGDIVKILPIHSCLTADLYSS